jgi:Rap1a immunity proteins
MRPLQVPLAIVLSLAAMNAAAADEVSPPASEWRGYCQAYVKALEGDKGVSDLDVTYCLGVTKGLLTGLRIGSQIGALSFGSQIVVKYNLDPDEIFKLFQTQDPSRVLGICSPASLATPDYVRAVLAHLEKNPDDLKRPIAEVFYEALQATYPCD